jgi:hypothetical protein
VLADVSFAGVGSSLALVFLLVLLRVLLRREWAAVAVWMVVLSPQVLVGEALPIVGAVALIENLLFYAVIRRFGLVALMVLGFVLQVSFDFPATLDSSAWHAGYGYVTVAVVAALAFYGFRTSLGGRPVFAGGALDG